MQCTAVVRWPNIVSMYMVFKTLAQPSTNVGVLTGEQGAQESKERRGGRDRAIRPCVHKVAKIGV